MLMYIKLKKIVVLQKKRYKCLHNCNLLSMLVVQKKIEKCKKKRITFFSLKYQNQNVLHIKLRMKSLRENRF